MSESDLYCAACDTPTDREVTEVFYNPKAPDITFPLCEDCDETDQMTEPTHEELVEQAEAVLEATKASMYYPVAHGEAAKLQTMIEERTEESKDE